MNGALPLLASEDLVLRAGARCLVSGLTLRVAAGEMWCVLGPNGSGKTTLLHTLAGPRPQTVHDSFSASALEVVLLGRHPYQQRWSWDDHADRRIALDALAAVDATALASRDVTTLSGGERQRVAIAALLAQQVPLMLLDEPTAHLDLKHQVGVLAHLQRLVHGLSTAAVLALHDLNLAARFATHALLLQPDGTTVGGPVHEVMSAERLSLAFDHPVRRERFDGRWIYHAG